MIINDLSHVETVLEDKNIQGGLAIAEAFSGGSAVGNSLAVTSTSTFTSAFSKSFRFRTFNSASSSSSSQSVSAN
ncbi:hypothetical protein LC653_31375 [Nostoc sp. CHAB 5784]|uniref:hypothetical protein n=1 Tax=Nostoc mirabile TaxID=2907820 RepID=UPI001E501454|nr:hypothetical protein [Nostoc mirabile]MCC5668244.1 hypothetical protein [Nostoc mirabile CHAB5784]